MRLIIRYLLQWGYQIYGLPTPLSWASRSNNDQIRVSNFILPQCVQVPSHVNQLLGKSKVLIEAEDEKDGHDHVVVVVKMQKTISSRQARSEREQFCC